MPDTHQPLAAQLRPTSLEDMVGQSHLIGPGKPLRVAVENSRLMSLIFWGPPGVGKTTLARILALATGHPYHELSAVSAGKADIRAIVEHIDTSQPAPVLFLDEIHRFNKAQQDFLLPYVERGDIILIGATTENPSFEVISALLSRTRVMILQPLTQDELTQVLDKALIHLVKSREKLKIPTDSRTWLLQVANGDARQLLTIVDACLSLYGDLSLKHLEQTLQTNLLRYDQTGEEHYNTISAYIKSLRAGDPDAALYYLARMVKNGEDPLFIARRMVIFASEDIGLGQPTALVVANAVFQAVSQIGYPEAQINLAHGTAYLSQCRKDRRAYDAYFAALADVEKHGNLPIPLKLRNAPTKLMKQIGYGQDYQMYDESSLLPDKLVKRHYLAPAPSAEKQRKSSTLSSKKLTK